MLIVIFATILMSLDSNMLAPPWIISPMAGILSAFFGVSSSFGLLSLLEYPACNLVGVIPFLVLGMHSLLSLENYA